MGQQTLLIVDDEGMICESLADYFGDEGFKVLQASSADQALLVLANTPVELLVSDIKMPGKIDGMELARRILSARPDFPVVLMSGGTAREDVQASFGNGVAFFAKPFDFRKLGHYVRTRLQAINNLPSSPPAFVAQTV